MNMTTTKWKTRKLNVPIQQNLQKQNASRNGKGKIKRAKLTKDPRTMSTNNVNNPEYIAN